MQRRWCRGAGAEMHGVCMARAWRVQRARWRGWGGHLDLAAQRQDIDGLGDLLPDLQGQSVGESEIGGSSLEHLRLRLGV